MSFHYIQTLRTFDCLYNFSSSSVRLRPFLSFSRIRLILIALISGFISFKCAIYLLIPCLGAHLLHSVQNKPLNFPYASCT